VAVTRRPSRTRFLLLILVLVSVTLVTLSQRGGSGAVGSLRSRIQDATAPLQRLVHDGLQPIGNFLAGAADYGSLRRENERLRQQVADMQNQGVAAAAEQAQAQRVLQQQGLPFAGDIKTVTAEVIDDDWSNFEDSVTVDKGSSSGVAVGQPVVATNGLVGSVARVTPGTAMVRLLTDPTFVAGVRLGSFVGSARGQGRGRALRFTFDQPLAPSISTSASTSTSGSGATNGSIKGSTKANGRTSRANRSGSFTVRKGTAVVTSGLPLEAFPQGIPVARVASFSDPPDAAQPTVTLTPLVNLTQLDFVQVELWSPQTGG
jgi:rod shape-determining protein MreC